LQAPAVDMTASRGILGTATYSLLALSSSLLHTTSRTPIEACQPIDKRRHKCAVATVFVCLLFLVPRMSQLALLWR